MKKVVFPLEVLPCATVGAALVRLGVTSSIVLIFYLAIVGMPPAATLAIPLLVAPLALAVTGFVWFISALGAFARDLRQLVSVAALIMMYLSPIFFPLTAVPAAARMIFYANPLAFVIESARAALFNGLWPDWTGLLAYTAVAWIFATAGYAWFVHVKPAFADVV